MLLISCNWHAVHRTNGSGGCGRDGRAPAVSGHRRRSIVVFRRIGILPRQHVAKAAHFLSHFYVNPNRSFIRNGSIDLQRKKKRNERRPSDAKRETRNKNVFRERMSRRPPTTPRSSVPNRSPVR